MRVAFTLIGHKDWTGGIHYLKNLLNVLHDYAKNTVRPVLFVGYDASPQEVGELRPFVEDIVAAKCFTKWAPSWTIRQSLRRVLDRDIVVERLFKRVGIDIVFHSGLMGRGFSLPCVDWIADFQHLHMPEMFLSSEIKARNRLFRSLADMSRIIVLSSGCARKDFESFLPNHCCRVGLLRFVAQIPEDCYSGNPWEKVRQYNVPEKFFHLPNQFWKHKNHIVVIRALALLKERNRDVFVVCTGNETDYRNPGHFAFLKNEISKYGLKDRIALLGFLPFEHLFAFMRQSAAIVNPSLFEGWSTTVEQAKSLGKKVLLSDIPVHNEQTPPGGTFFDPESPEDLADKMLQVWQKTSAGPDHQMEAEARSHIKDRLQSFAKAFEGIIRAAAGQTGDYSQ